MQKNGVAGHRLSPSTPVRIRFDHNQPAIAFRHARYLLALCMIWLAALTVRADNCPTLIRTFDSDAYQSSFFSRTYSPSFYAGEDPYGEYRSFFIFNIPTLTQTVVSAELWLS